MKTILFILLPLILMSSFKSYCIPKLNSFPFAKATIFLDFDGQTVTGTSWNKGNILYCAPSGLNDTQIKEIFNRVSEDYRPFNINITTDSTVFLEATLTQRIRIIITPTSGWYTRVGGVSFTGSFIWGDDTPGFVFSDRLNNSPKLISECCSHESGHTVGLSHQAKYNGDCALVATYNEGAGTGEISWSPVMGNSYYRNLSGWNNGPTPSGCTADQDNLSIITSRNGFTYRLDDHSDDPANNPTVIDIVHGEFVSEGIITTNTDKDVFKITIPADGKVILNAKPYSVGPNNEGADLDIQVTLLNSSMKVLQSYNPEDKLDVSIETLLMAGNYYVRVQGVGNRNTTNYGSLGSYTISGTFNPLIVMPISRVLLLGEKNKGSHFLNWNIITDEVIQNLVLESSLNGTVFTTLTGVSSEKNSFNYKPLLTENLFYRLKATSVTGQVLYSNIISLKPVENIKQSFTISTLVKSEISINASQDFSYQLADISGRLIKSGNAKTGLTNINIGNSSKGIYIIQIISNHQRTTQRIARL
ncbi:MAG: T9SS type A sorting domain-containing protein [Ginsengibacter sp.]